MENCLLSVDLNTTRLNNQNYSNLIHSLNCNLEIHIYNYIEQKHSKIEFNNNEIYHQYMGSRKKVALDIPQALDIIELCAKNSYDKVYILCGEFESDYLYNKLHEMNINIVKINPTSLRQVENVTYENKNAEKLLVSNNDVNIQKTIEFEKEVAITNQDKQNNGTKLTPEQIKKIYTYIKLKQMQSKLKKISS